MNNIDKDCYTPRAVIMGIVSLLILPFLFMIGTLLDFISIMKQKRELKRQINS